MESRGIRAARLALIALALGVSAAHAGLLGKLIGGGTAAAAASGGRKTYDANTLTPAQLKTCLIDAHQIDVASAQFDRDKEALHRGHEELERAARQLQGKGEKDPRVVEFRAKQKAFNDSVDAANAKLVAARGAGERFSRDCNNKRYFQSDIQQVRAELPPEVRQSMAAAK